MSPHPRLELYRTLSLRPSQRHAWRLVVGVDVVAIAGEGYSKRSHARTMAHRVASGHYSGARLDVYRTRSLRPSQRWAWRLWSGSDIVATSAEGYRDKGNALRMGDQVRKGAYREARVAGPGWPS